MNKIGFLHRTHWRGLSRDHMNRIAELLTERGYQPPSEFSFRSLGTAVSDESSALTAIGDYWVARIIIGGRSVPAPLLNGRLEERVRQLTGGGVRVSAKDRKRLKAEIEQELLPQMPVNESSVYLALLPHAQSCWVWGTQANCDLVAGFLAEIAIEADLTIGSIEPVADEMLRRWVLNPSSLPAGLALGARMVVKDDEGHTLTLNGWSIDFSQKMRLLNQGGALREVGMTFDDVLEVAVEPNASHLRRITPTPALFEQWQASADPEACEIVRDVGGVVLLSAIDRLLTVLDRQQTAMAEAV